MQPENSIPVAGQPPASDKDGKAVQAEAQSDTEPFDAEGESLDCQSGGRLESKIDEAKRRNDMPMISALGNPGWEQRAADGHLDVPDQDDE